MLKALQAGVTVNESDASNQLVPFSEPCSATAARYVLSWGFISTIRQIYSLGSPLSWAPALPMRR